MELEEQLSLPELTALVSGIREAESKRFKQQAALKGIDLDKKVEEDPIERAKRKALGDNPETNDVVNLIKSPGLQKHLGFEAGLGYEVEE